MKKCISAILILFFIVLTSSTLFGCNNEKNYYTNIKDEDIALLTLFSFDGKNERKWGLLNLGHAFISIENISNNNIFVSGFELKPNETVSFGTWFIFEHSGVWFNIESNYIKNYDKYNSRVSITSGISSDDLLKISDFINSNDNWNMFKNCSYFSLNLWNSVAENSEYIKTPLIYTPNYISTEISKFETFETNKIINTSEELGYFKNETYLTYKLEGEKY